MIERELTAEETKRLYDKICQERLEPYTTEHDRKSADAFYLVEGKKYRLIYTPDLDWFCDIAYEGNY